MPVIPQAASVAGESSQQPPKVANCMAMIFESPHHDETKITSNLATFDELRLGDAFLSQDPPVLLKHRQKQPNNTSLAWGLVTRPLTRKDPEFHSEAAQKAIQSELDKMLKANVWDLKPREKADILKELHSSEEAHFGDLFLILGIKNAELPEAQRKVKARGVFRGSFIQNQDAQQTFFSEVQSTPATLGSVKVAMAWAALNRGTIESVDCEAAYLQAPFKGVQTWIKLPREWLTPEQLRMKEPVFRLQKCLIWPSGIRKMVGRAFNSSPQVVRLDCSRGNTILLCQG